MWLLEVIGGAFEQPIVPSEKLTRRGFYNIVASVQSVFAGQAVRRVTALSVRAAPGAVHHSTRRKEATMAEIITRADYFYIEAPNTPGEAARETNE